MAEFEYCRRPNFNALLLLNRALGLHDFQKRRVPGSTVLIFDNSILELVSFVNSFSVLVVDFNYFRSVNYLHALLDNELDQSKSLLIGYYFVGSHTFICQCIFIIY